HQAPLFGGQVVVGGHGHGDGGGDDDLFILDAGAAPGVDEPLFDFVGFVDAQQEPVFLDEDVVGHIGHGRLTFAFALDLAGFAEAVDGPVVHGPGPADVRRFSDHRFGL